MAQPTHPFSIDTVGEPPLIRNRRVTALRIAGYFGPRLTRDLPLVAEVFPLEGDAAPTLGDWNPSLVLVEAAAMPQPAILNVLLAWCRENGVPPVLWVTDSAAPDPSAGFFPFVFIADTARLAEYRAACPSSTVTLLEPWVEPALFNPFVTNETRASGARLPVLALGAAAGFVDEFAEIAKMGGAVLNPSGAAPTALTSRAVVVQSDDQWRGLLRSTMVVVTPAAGERADELTYSALEAASSGALVLHLGKLPQDHPLKGFVTEISGAAELETTVHAMVAEPTTREILVNRRRRRLLRDHCLAKRLQAMGATIGVEVGWEEYPVVTVFVPTRRPQLLRRCVEQYRLQSYPYKELVIVLNLREINRAEIEAIQAQNDDVRIFCISQERNVGTAMNLAVDVAKGVHCVKMDDDDYYGPDYVLDMMLNLRAIDADLYGKPPLFVYMEELDATYRRTRQALQFCILDNEDFANLQVRISGATHSGRTDVLREIRFPSLNRGAVDSALYRRTADRNLVICTFDGYGTLIFRSADILQHTWRAGKDVIMLGADREGDGIARERVFP